MFSSAALITSNRRPFRALAWLATCLSLAGLAGAASAGVVGDGTPGSCTQGALQTQIFNGGLVTFSCGAAPATIAVNLVYVPAEKEVTIDGGDLITLDGGGIRQIMSVSGGNGVLSKIVIRNIRFANGLSDTGLNAGGAIVNSGNLTLENVTFTNNKAPFGGAIMSQACVDCTVARVDVRRSRFTGNSGGSGGAINLQGGILTVTDSTFDGNTVTGTGGAIDLFSNADYYVAADIANSTFTGNSANRGGAIEVAAFNAGSAVSIRNSTFTNNTATGSIATGGAIRVGTAPTVLNGNTIAGNTGAAGGGIQIDANGVVLRNTIISGNTGGNCAGAPFVDEGGNLQSAGGTCGAIPTGDARLGALASNGGPTQTMALGAGSAAIDAGTNPHCSAADQRGNLRADGDGNGSVVCDSGAFEVASVPRTAPLQLRYSTPEPRRAIALNNPAITPGPPPTEFAYDTPSYYAIADFNGDGLPDVFIAPAFHGTQPNLPVQILLSQGNGVFVDGTAGMIEGTVPVTSHAAQILIGDFNEDGRPDVLVVDRGSNGVLEFPMTLLLSQPNGKYVNASNQIAPNISGFGTAGAVGDFNGDGHLDLVMNRDFDTGSPSRAGVSLFYGDGKGNLVDASSALPAAIRFGPNTPRIDPQRTACVGAADLDGDGRAELVTGPSGAGDSGAGGPRTLRFFKRGTTATSPSRDA